MFNLGITQLLVLAIVAGIAWGITSVTLDGKLTADNVKAVVAAVRKNARITTEQSIQMTVAALILLAVYHLFVV